MARHLLAEAARHPSKSRPPMSHRKTDLGIPLPSKSAKVVLGKLPTVPILVQEQAFAQLNLIWPLIADDRTLRTWRCAHNGGAGFDPSLDSYSHPSAELVILLP